MTREDADPTTDASTVQHTVRCSWADGDSPSVRVVEAVAAVTDRAPERMRPLYDVVDPESLDRLVGRDTERNSTLSVTFRYADCDVSVRDDGRIAVVPPSPGDP